MIFLEDRNSCLSSQPTFQPAPPRSRHQLSRARFSATAAGWRDAGIARGLRRTAALPQLLGDLVRALRARAAGIRRVCRDPRRCGYGWTGAADD